METESDITVDESLDDAGRAKLELQQLQQILESQKEDSESEEDDDCREGSDDSSASDVECVQENGAQELLDRFLASSFEAQFDDIDISENQAGDCSEKADVGTALLLNQTYQGELRSLLTAVEQAMQENKDRQAELKEEIDEILKSKATMSLENQKHIRLSRMPAFVDGAGLTPLPNAEIVQRKLLKMVHHLRPVRSFRAKDVKKLHSCVALDTKKKELLPLQNKLEILQSKLAAGGLEVEAAEELRSSLIEIRAQLAHVKSLSNDELLAKHDPEAVDWLKISATDFNGEFNWSTLRGSWVQLLQPRLAAHGWSEAEDQCLVELAREHDLRDWETIARRLGDKRSAFQCAQRYQTKFGKNSVVREWTDEEDELLKEVVEGCRIGKHINWTQVSYFMDERYNDECAARWRRVNPEIRRGAFDIKEDQLIVKAFQVFGPNFQKIARFVPNRSAIQCKERFYDALAEDLKHGPFTYEEDKKLVELVAASTKKISFVEIAKQIPGRSDQLLARRWNKLCQWRKENEWLCQQSPDTLRRLVCLYTRAGSMNESRYRETLVKVQKLRQQMEQSIVDRELEHGVFWNRSDNSALPNELISEMRQVFNREIDQLHNLVSDTLSNSGFKGNVNQKHLDELQRMKGDLENGLYVPRPILFVPEPSLSVKDDGPNTSLKLIRDFINEEMSKKIKPTSSYQTKMRNLAQTLSSSAVMRRLRTIPKSQTVLRKMRRFRSRQLSADVMAEVLRLVRGRTTSRKSGRPRVFFKETFDEDEHTTYIAALLMKALRADVAGMCARAVRLRDRHVQKAQQPDLPAHERENFDRRRTFLEDNSNLLVGISKCAEIFKSEEVQSSKAESAPRYFVEPSLYSSAPLSPFHLPAFPPNVTSVHGFKSLLMQRRKLQRIAGNLYEPRNREPTATLRKRYNVVEDSSLPSEKRARLSGDLFGGETRAPDPTESVPNGSERTVQGSLSTAHGSTTVADAVAAHTSTTSPLENAVNNSSFITFVDRFVSLFLWPALLSTISTLPEKKDAHQQSSHHKQSNETQEERTKRKKKKLLCMTRTKKAVNLRKDKVGLELKKKRMSLITRIRSSRVTEEEKDRWRQELEELTVFKDARYEKMQAEGIRRGKLIVTNPNSKRRCRQKNKDAVPVRRSSRAKPPAKYLDTLPLQLLNVTGPKRSKIEKIKKEVVAEDSSN